MPTPTHQRLSSQDLAAFVNNPGDTARQHIMKFKALIEGAATDPNYADTLCEMLNKSWEVKIDGKVENCTAITAILESESASPNADFRGFFFEESPNGAVSREFSAGAAGRLRSLFGEIIKTAEKNEKFREIFFNALAFKDKNRCNGLAAIICGDNNRKYLEDFFSLFENHSSCISKLQSFLRDEDEHGVTVLESCLEKLGVGANDLRRADIDRMIFYFGGPNEVINLLSQRHASSAAHLLKNAFGHIKTFFKEVSVAPAETPLETAPLGDSPEKNPQKLADSTANSGSSGTAEEMLTPESINKLDAMIFQINKSTLSKYYYPEGTADSAANFDSSGTAAWNFCAYNNISVKTNFGRSKKFGGDSASKKTIPEKQAADAKANESADIPKVNVNPELTIDQREFTLSLMPSFAGAVNCYQGAYAAELGLAGSVSKKRSTILSYYLEAEDLNLMAYANPSITRMVLPTFDKYKTHAEMLAAIREGRESVKEMTDDKAKLFISLFNQRLENPIMPKLYTWELLAQYCRVLKDSGFEEVEATIFGRDHSNPPRNFNNTALSRLHFMHIRAKQTNGEKKRLSFIVDLGSISGTALKSTLERRTTNDMSNENKLLESLHKTVCNEALKKATNDKQREFVRNSTRIGVVSNLSLYETLSSGRKLDTNSHVAESIDISTTNTELRFHSIPSDTASCKMQLASRNKDKIFCQLHFDSEGKLTNAYQLTNDEYNNEAAYVHPVLQKAHEKGLNIHVTNRDEKTVIALNQLKERNIQRGFDESLSQAYVDEVVEKIMRSSFSNKERAVEVITKQNGAFPALIGDPQALTDFKMSGLIAFAHIAFSILQRKDEVQQQSLQSLVAGLNEGFDFCIQGKIQKVMVSTVQGYEEGIMIDDIEKLLTAMDLVTLFFEEPKNKGEEGDYHLYERSEHFFLMAAEQFIKEVEKPYEAGAKEVFLEEVTKKFAEADGRRSGTTCFQDEAIAILKRYIERNKNHANTEMFNAAEKCYQLLISPDSAGVSFTKNELSALRANEAVLGPRLFNVNAQLCNLLKPTLGGQTWIDLMSNLDRMNNDEVVAVKKKKEGSYDVELKAGVFSSAETGVTKNM